MKQKSDDVIRELEGILENLFDNHKKWPKMSTKLFLLIKDCKNVIFKRHF